MEIPISWIRFRGVETARDTFCAASDVSIEWYLLLALRDVYGARYVDRKRLARMASGSLALVSESTKEGDIITSFPTGRRDFQQYLFHRIRVEGDYIAIEDRILRAADERTSSDGSGLFRAGEIARMRAPEGVVMHCEFIGECFVEDYTSSWARLKPPLKTNTEFESAIVAIH